MEIIRFRYLRADVKKQMNKAKQVLQLQTKNVVLLSEADFNIVKMLGRVEERIKDLKQNSKVLVEYQIICDELMKIHKQLEYAKMEKKKVQIVNRSKDKKSDALLICPVKLEVRYK